MKRTISLLSMVMLMLLSTHFAEAQISAKEARKAAKEAKKEAKKQALEENMDIIKEMVHNKNVVLEADMIRGRYHSTNNVFGPNFIKVERDEIIIQTSNPFGLGYNGLGGVTVRGTITGYEVKEKEGSITALIQFSSTVLGHTTVNLVANASGHANAYVRTNFGQRVTFIGDVASLDKAPFEGMSLF